MGGKALLPEERRDKPQPLILLDVFFGRKEVFQCCSPSSCRERPAL